MAISLLGAIRFYRQQTAMAVGKVHAGGWEVIIVSVWMFVVSIEAVSLCRDCADVWAASAFDVCGACSD